MARRILWLKALLFAAVLAGLASSPKLWLGQELYPAVPFFSFVPYLRGLVPQLLLGALLVSMAAALFGKRREAAGLAAGLAVVIVLQDQARFQPWAWQYFLWFLALALLSAEEAATFLRWLTILIYAASGLQKLNAGFIEGPGRMLFGDWGPLLLAAPLFELSLVPLLAIRSARLVGLAGSLILHATVLILLAQSGLNSVIWPWNAFMMLSNVLLFLESGADQLGRRPRWALAAVALLPALRLVGADAYPGFALYSGQIENSMLLVEEKAGRRLPGELRSFLVEPVEEDGKVWLKLDHNAWSYWALNAPPYPQHRVQTAGAAWLCRRYYGPGETGLRLAHYSQPGWLSGRMDRRPLAGCRAIAEDAKSYRLNASAAN